MYLNGPCCYLLPLYHPIISIPILAFILFYIIFTNTILNINIRKIGKLMCYLLFFRGLMDIFVELIKSG